MSDEHKPQLDLLSKMTPNDLYKRHLDFLGQKVGGGVGIDIKLLIEHSEILKAIHKNQLEIINLLKIISEK